MEVLMEFGEHNYKSHDEYLSLDEEKKIMKEWLKFFGEPEPKIDHCSWQLTSLAELGSSEKQVLVSVVKFLFSNNDQGRH